jgi:hypothetical protein
LGTYLRECKEGYNRDTCTSIFIAELLTISNTWKQTRYPTMMDGWMDDDEWIKKMWSFTQP